MRITYGELRSALETALTGLGLDRSRASLCARLIADASRDGVPSHGLNFFPRFVRMVRAGVIDVTAEPVRIAAAGAIERWDGRRGPGNLNAYASMDRAIALAREHGIACVALANTNHWWRGGTYGWQAADAGAIAFCWTNTMANMPPYGATRALVGNNPLVVAVPRPDGHVVLDMALSQFSFGALAGYRSRGEPLPVPGGFDDHGELTRDAAAVERTGRALPIGFWKGSGLSIVLDLIAAMLSGGRATHEIPVGAERETAVSQVFVAVDPIWCAGCADRGVADRVLEHLRLSSPGEPVRYPGERTLAVRERNLREGIPVDESSWQFVQSL